MNQLKRIMNSSDKNGKDKMINWINGYNAGNKKEKYSLTFRLGTFTVLELRIAKGKLRFMVCNFGFEI